ncbi:hypothetical protein OSTOST_11339, partial [Ostertagia ostertagi]
CVCVTQSDDLCNSNFHSCRALGAASVRLPQKVIISSHLIHLMQRYSSKVFGNKTNLVVEQNEQEGGFSAASLSLRAQKKIASKLSTRKVTKLFISESVDRVYRQSIQCTANLLLEEGL